MSGEDYLGWRRAAVIATPPTPQAALDAEQTRQLELDATALQADVAAFLQSPQVLSEVLTPEHGGMLRPADSDWSAYHAQCLKRVRDVNGLGGPRMHIVWHGTLAKLGRIPMLPDEGDSQHILDAERLVEAWIANMDAHGKVDGRALCISFFSHRWERPTEAGGGPHPDTADHKKAKALASYGAHGT